MGIDGTGIAFSFFSARVMEMLAAAKGIMAKKEESKL